MNRIASLLVVTATLAGCASPAPSTPASLAPSAAASESEVAAASPAAARTEYPEPSQPPNPCEGDVAELPVGATCWTEPNALAALADDTTPVRVLYTIPAAGWAPFLGPFKDVGEGEELQRVNVNFADIRNLTDDACTHQVPAQPPVGPTVDDLAAALAALPPFEVTSPPSDVIAFGYRGKHLEVRVPDDVSLMTCDGGVLRTWIAPPLSFAFYGYTAPGDTEEFWILDVDDVRIVIAALRSANASAEMLAEQQAVLDSIVIER